MSELTVSRVWRDYRGSVISETLSIGATEVDVENIVDFDEEGGDFVLGDDSGTYTGIVESETDETAGTVVGLSPAVTIAHPEGTFLYDGDHERGPKRCDGFLDGDDSLVEGVFIPSHLRRLFPLGKRARENMEVVSVAFDDDGSPYVTDGPIEEDVAAEPVVFTWSLSGNVSVGTRPHRFPVPFGGTIEEVKMVMGDGGAPTGSSIIVDILKGGTSILGTKVIVPDGDLGSNLVEPTSKRVQKGNILQIEFEQVGSTLPGSDPTLYVTMFPSDGATAGRIEIEGPAGPAGSDGSDGVITEVQDEGVALADQPILNVTGAGKTLTVSGGKYVLDIPGGGGSGSDIIRFTPSTTSAGSAPGATEGIVVNPPKDIDLVDVFPITTSSGLTMRFRVYELTSGNVQVGSALYTSPTWTSDGNWHHITLATPLTLTGGTRYALALQNTASAGWNYKYGSSTTDFLLGSVFLCRISNTDPLNGAAWSVDSSYVIQVYPGLTT